MISEGDNKTQGQTPISKFFILALELLLNAMNLR